MESYHDGGIYGKARKPAGFAAEQIRFRDQSQAKALGLTVPPTLLIEAGASTSANDPRRNGALAPGPNQSRCGGRLFVIPGRVQHAVGLEITLEAGEHERPAFADRIEHLAVFGEVVVRDGELDLVLLLFQIDYDARGLLGPVERFVHRLERVG